MHDLSSQGYQDMQNFVEKLISVEGWWRQDTVVKGNIWHDTILNRILWYKTIRHRHALSCIIWCAQQSSDSCQLSVAWCNAVKCYDNVWMFNCYCHTETSWVVVLLQVHSSQLRCFCFVLHISSWLVGHTAWPYLVDYLYPDLSLVLHGAVCWQSAAKQSFMKGYLFSPCFCINMILSIFFLNKEYGMEIM